MSVTVMLFLVWAMMTIAFLVGAAGGEKGPRLLEFYQVGDTSLGRNSVNWLAAIAFSAVIVICFFLI